MKYKLTDETILFNGKVLRRIQALKDFGGVKAGEFGGWIESEDNLSQEGDCWVYDNALVSDGARIFDNARVSGNALVSDSAQVCDKALVSGNIWVSGDARIYGDARISGYARVSDKI